MAAKVARPASTVALIRDGVKGLEILLLKRNNALLFAAGMWVFPGGSIEPQDFDLSNGDIDDASRIAASRETYEESGLHIGKGEMVFLSHWITPATEQKRFSTRIYFAPIKSGQDVIIDHSEIHNFRWITVKEAIVSHKMNRLNMLPPTYLTLILLARYNSIKETIKAVANRTPFTACGVFSKTANNGTLIAMFSGDAGYETADSTISGAKHRAIFNGKFWNYIREDLSDTTPDFSQ